MTTFQGAIEHSRQYLMTGQQERLNILDQSINDTVTSIIIRNELKSIIEGTRIAIDLEEMHVLAVTGTVAGSSATVIRGYNGSTAAAHTAGAVIRVNAQFTDFRIGTEINEELRDLSNPMVGLFRIRPIEFTFNPAVMGYSLNATDIVDIWRVRYEEPGPTNQWPVYRRDEWYLDQDAATTEFPQGKQLVLRVPAYPGHIVRVSYKATFGGPLTTTTDDVLNITGLHTEAHDILSIGAALRLLMGRDIKRSFMENQPEPRRSDEVGTTAATLAMRPLGLKYQERIESEVARLNQRYPEQL